jgi:hypothetical protein
MTVSVKTSQVFMGGPISLVALSKLEQRSFPVSVRSLIAPVETKTFSSTTEAGDVTARVTFVMSNRGHWSVSAAVHDSGTFFGDGFVLDVILAGTPGVGQSFRGMLGTGDTVNFTGRGIDAFVRDHYTEINTLHVHLEANADIGAIITTVITVLFGVSVIAFFASGPKIATPCPDSTPEHQCVQFRDASTDTGGAVPTG